MITPAEFYAQQQGLAEPIFKTIEECNDQALLEKLKDELENRRDTCYRIMMSMLFDALKKHSFGAQTRDIRVNFHPEHMDSVLIHMWNKETEWCEYAKLGQVNNSRGRFWSRPSYGMRIHKLETEAAHALFHHTVETILATRFVDYPRSRVQGFAQYQLPNDADVLQKLACAANRRASGMKRKRDAEEAGLVITPENTFTAEVGDLGQYDLCVYISDEVVPIVVTEIQRFKTGAKKGCVSAIICREISRVACDAYQHTDHVDPVAINGLLQKPRHRKFEIPVVYTKDCPHGRMSPKGHGAHCTLGVPAYRDANFD